MNDTRKDKRAPVSLKVRFKSATVDEFVEHYSSDVSHGGLFIKSKQPMAVGTLLKFELQLKDESKLIQGVGRVVWKREASDGGSDANPAGMGIKFIKMDPESRGLVDKIVEGRGTEPGQYEAGGGDGKDAGGDEVVASPAPAPRPVRSAKATMQFFPSAGPTEAEMPPPEDRTQVRQASEFLAAALAEGGADDLASKEAEQSAVEARKRTAEIEKERDAAAQRAKDEADAKERAEKEARDRAEREKREAEEREKAEAEAKKREAADKVAADKAAKEKAVTDEAASKRAAEKAAKESAAKKSAASAESKATDAKPDVKTATPAPVPAEPQSMMVPIVVVLVLVLGVGGYFAFAGGGSGGGREQTPTQGEDTEGTPPEGTEGTPPEGTEGTPPEGTEGTPPEGTEGTPPEGAEGTPPEGTEGMPPEGTEGTPPEGTPPEGTEGTPPEGAEAVDSAPPAEPISFRVETTPPGAEIRVSGTASGTSPASLALPPGEISIVAHLEGYRDATSTVTVAEGQRTVRMTLEALPFQIEVTTTPPGATVRAGGRSTTSPGRLVLTRQTRDVRVSASLSGYTTGTQTVALTSFTSSGDAMVARVEIALVAAPVAPAGGGTRRPRPEGGETTAGGGGSEPAGGGGSEPAGGGSEPAGGGGGETGGSEEAPPENPF